MASRIHELTETLVVVNDNLGVVNENVVALSQDKCLSTKGGAMKLLGLMWFVLFVVLPVNTYSFEINGRYLNYGNGMINLDNVTHINPRINYIVTIPEDETADYFKQFGTSNVSDSSHVLGLYKWFNSESLDKLDYYFIEIEAYVKFDDFTLP